MRSLVFMLVIATGCSTQLNLENRPCPCSSGWSCCANMNVCARNGTSCPTPALAVTPASASLALEHTLQLTSTTPVVWSVAEQGGGTITEAGRYQAPLRLGTFHVVATSTVDREQQVSVPVTVGPTTLDLEAGQPGGPGYADDVGLDARFYYPTGITTDGADHLFVADGRIRRVDVATGAVTTVSAGLPGWSASDLTYDNGTLYVVGWNGVYNVFATDPESGVSTLLSGGGGSQMIDGAGAGAQFGSISGITSDGNGRLYVLDSPVNDDNDGAVRIRRIDIASRAVTTVAGSAAPFGTPPRDGVGLAAVLSAASGIAFDGAQVMFLDTSQTGAGELRTFDPVSATVATTGFSVPATGGTFAGSVCNAGYVAPGPFVWPALPSLPGYDLHRAIAGTTQTGDADGSGGLFSSRPQLACAGTSIYVGDYGNCAIRTIDLSNNDTVTTLAGQSGHDATSLQQPLGVPVEMIALAADGSLLLSSGETLDRLDVAHGLYTTILTDAQLSYAHVQGVTVDVDGVYVTLQNTDNPPQAFVAMVDTNARSFTNIAGGVAGVSRDGIGSAARFGSPAALVSDGNGSLYIADAGAGAIRRLELATRAVSTVVANLVAPQFLAYGSNALFVGEPSVGPPTSGNIPRGAIVRVALDSGVVSSVIDDGKFGSYGRLAYDPAGVLYVADGVNGVIRAIDGSGETIDVIGQRGRQGVKAGPIPAGLNAPGALLLSGEDLYISDEIEAVILRAHLAR